tara:strand:+ start:3121 stop:3630 length:510 start_codon:yes stop_codon:yes gene_type:complete
MNGIPKLHLAFLLILCLCFLFTYQYLGALATSLSAILVCALFVGRLATAITLFVGIVLFSMYRIGIAIDPSSLAFVVAGGSAYLLAGNQRLTYRLDNFGQGALYAGWMASLLWLMNLAIDFNTITSIVGADIAVMLSPLLYGYVVQGVCEMSVKMLEADVEDQDDYFGK